MTDLSKLTDEELCKQAMGMEWSESIEIARAALKEEK